MFELAMAQQSSYKVVVRSYFDDMTVQKAQTTDQLYTAYVSDFMTSSDDSSSDDDRARNLRRQASRELLTWCQSYCSNPSYGCKWCKVNDRAYGANCNRYCRRREEEDSDSEDSQVVDVFASYTSDRTLFTPEQDAACAAMLASMVSVKVVQYVFVVHFSLIARIRLTNHSCFVLFYFESAGIGI
jgi:hypothetical protein